MKRNRILVFVVLAFIFNFALPVHAGEETAGDSAAGMGTKLGRGLWNVVSSPAEIPCNISDDMHKDAASGFFTGLGKGLVLMGRRILVGVTEVATFVIPMPATIPPVCKNTPVS